MVSVNVSSQDAGIEGGLGLLRVDDLTSLTLDFLDNSFLVAWESSGGVGHVDATVAGTLEHGENSGTSGSWSESDIEKGLEWSLLIIEVLLNLVVNTISGVVNLVHIGEADLLQESSGEQETSAVAGSVVSKTSSDAEVLQFGRLSGAKDLVSSHGSINNLGDVFSVSSSDDESVLLGVILVLVLSNKLLSSKIVGFTLSSSLGLDLSSLEEGVVLDNFNECH